MLDYVSWLCNHIRFYFTISYLSGICYCRTFSQTGFQVKILEFMHLIPSKIFNPCTSRVTDRFCRPRPGVKILLRENQGYKEILVTKKISNILANFPQVELVRRRTPVLLQVRNILYLTKIKEYVCRSTSPPASS